MVTTADFTHFKEVGELDFDRSELGLLYGCDVPFCDLEPSGQDNVPEVVDKRSEEEALCEILNQPYIPYSQENFFVVSEVFFKYISVNLDVVDIDQANGKHQSDQESF